MAVGLGPNTGDCVRLGDHRRPRDRLAPRSGFARTALRGRSVSTLAAARVARRPAASRATLATGERAATPRWGEFSRIGRVERSTLSGPRAGLPNADARGAARRATAAFTPDRAFARVGRRGGVGVATRRTVPGRNRAHVLQGSALRRPASLAVRSGNHRLGPRGLQDLFGRAARPGRQRGDTRGRERKRQRGSRAATATLRTDPRARSGRDRKSQFARFRCAVSGGARAPTGGHVAARAQWRARTRAAPCRAWRDPFARRRAPTHGCHASLALHDGRPRIDRLARCGAKARLFRARSAWTWLESGSATLGARER